MRKFIYILTILILILISCSNKNEQKGQVIETNSATEIVKKTTIKIDTAKIDVYFKELKGWLNYYNQYSINLKNFELIKQEKLPNITAKVDDFNLSNDIYKPFYKYSNDSNKILDLISYNLVLEKNEQKELVSFGGDVDSEVSIKDLENKLWRRLLFVGTFHIIEDGFWINNNQLLIVGEFNDTDQKKPSIWFVDLKANIIQTFEYENYIDNMNCNYLENVKYKNIKIAE
jgi:hypothetical protein